ncbi:MAG TPA: hypothetical protein VEU33_14590 [Archangium sp.]|nr:hypothetical protein [Archangium sp.]
MTQNAETTGVPVVPPMGLEQLGDDGPACTLDGFCVSSSPEAPDSTPIPHGDKAP